MKKLCSLINACMSSDMKIFKVKTKKNSKIIPVILMLYIMFAMWSGASRMFEKLTPMNLGYLVLALFVFSISLMTIIEGIYKVGPLMFNCKDDQLLLSLPIERRTVLFIRIFKFYIFELLFNSLFLAPVMIAYIRWNPNISWTYFLTSITMLLLSPIIPIVISCIIGTITSSISSRFKYKNIVQIIISMMVLLSVLYISYNIESIYNYVIKHATSLNDLITKIYYPAGAYANMVTNFKTTDFILFIVINILLFTVTIFILSIFYFKINSRLKNVSTKKVKISKLTIRSNSVSHSLIKKELNTFFKTPVFIVNAGFALVLFIIASIAIPIKYNSFINFISSPNSGFGISKELIINNRSIIVLVLIVAAGFMTSITNSLISLEGKNINILKSLPIQTKKILMSKIYACLVITTPVLLIGDLILLIRLKISVIESLLLLALSIIIPLVSHFIGLIINLKYPKLDFDNSAEVVKQSTSSFVSVMLGMGIMITYVIIITKIAGKISSSLILLGTFILFLIVDIVLYLILTKKGVKEFNKLTI